LHNASIVFVDIESPFFNLLIVELLMPPFSLRVYVEAFFIFAFRLLIFDFMRNTKHGFILVLVSGCLLSSVVFADDLLADKPTPAKAGAAVTLPKEWKTDERGGSRNLLLARAPSSDKDNTGEFQAIFSLDADTIAKLDGRAQQAAVAKKCDNYQVVEEPSDVAIGGVEGVMFGGSFTIGSVKLRSRQYLLLQNGRVYILTFTALESAWANYDKAIKACAASVTLPSVSVQ